MIRTCTMFLAAVSTLTALGQAVVTEGTGDRRAALGMGDSDLVVAGPESRAAERAVRSRRVAVVGEPQRVALVAHPASVTQDLTHSLDALMDAGVNVTSAFGPQHGLKGDKQDNMVETADETDPQYGIPVFSLYGEVRRPTGQMMSSADVFLFDLQ